MAARRSSPRCWRSACCSRSMSRRAARKRRRVACRGEGDLLAVAPQGAGTESLRPVPRRRLAAVRAASATELCDGDRRPRLRGAGRARRTPHFIHGRDRCARRMRMQRATAHGSRLEAAFVDIGLEKNGFLHVDEIVLPGVEAPRRGRGSASARKIADLLSPGQEIVVQVVKDPLKTKGARLSMELTIAGRYMVYAPTGEGIGVSRRLEDKERERLRRQTAKLEIGGGGVIVRTAARGAKREDLERQLQDLANPHDG